MLRRKPANPSTSDPTALRAEIELRTTLTELQDHPALLTALSPQERDAERELAEWEREHSRSRRRRQLKAADKAERRAQRTATQLANASHRDREWLQRALSARRRALTPDAQLARVFRRSTVTARVLIGVVILGMLWAGVNVQANLVPDRDVSNPLFWLSFGIEAMFSVPLILIMLHAQTAAELGEETQRGTIVLLEVALLGGSIALNAGPHYAAGELARGLEFSAAPVMIGVAIWLHAWLSNRYARLISKTLTTAGAPDGDASATLDPGATLDPLAPASPALEVLAPTAASASPAPHHDTPAPATAPAPRTSHLAPASAGPDAGPTLAPAEPRPAVAEPPAEAQPSEQSPAPDNGKQAPAPARTTSDLDNNPAPTEPAPASAGPNATTAAATAPDAEPSAEPRTEPTRPLAPASPAPDTTAPAPTAASASPAPHQPAPEPALAPPAPALAGARMHQPAPPTSNATRSASHAGATIATANASAVVRALPAPRTDDTDHYEVLAQRIIAAELIKKKTPEQIATVLRMLDQNRPHAEITRATKTPYAGGIHHKTIKAIEAAAEQVKVPVRAVR